MADFPETAADGRDPVYRLAADVAIEEVAGTEDAVEFLVLRPGSAEVTRLSGDARRVVEAIRRGEQPDGLVGLEAALAHLIDAGVVVASGSDSVSRRRMLGAMAGTAAAVGMVTLALPGAAAAASDPEAGGAGGESGAELGTVTGGATDEVISSGGVSYRLYTFTSNGTFEVTTTGPAEVLLVAGGGGGGGGDVSGGGGAGGVVGPTSITLSETGTYSVNVGAGGAGRAFNSTAVDGYDLYVGLDGESSSITGPVGFAAPTVAVGGGGGGAPAGGVPTQSRSGRAGGSGGGAGGGGSSTFGTGTAGQGNEGGDKKAPFSGDFSSRGGGGGGAGAAGASAATGAGDGGIGVDISTFIGAGSAVYVAGGGGGAGTNLAGTGGQGGGGAGALTTSTAGGNATANTGGGGGGARSATGGNGAAGVVYIRVPV